MCCQHRVRELYTDNTVSHSGSSQTLVLLAIEREGRGSFPGLVPFIPLVIRRPHDRRFRPLWEPGPSGGPTVPGPLGSGGEGGAAPRSRPRISDGVSPGGAGETLRVRSMARIQTGAPRPLGSAPPAARRRDRPRCPRGPLRTQSLTRPRLRIASHNRFSNALLPRCSRDITVPIGTSRMSAISR